MKKSFLNKGFCLACNESHILSDIWISNRQRLLRNIFVCGHCPWPHVHGSVTSWKKIFSCEFLAFMTNIITIFGVWFPRKVLRRGSYDLILISLSSYQGKRYVIGSVSQILLLRLAVSQLYVVYEIIVRGKCQSDWFPLTVTLCLWFIDQC